MNFYDVYDMYGYVGTYTYEKAVEVATLIYESGQSASMTKVV